MTVYIDTFVTSRASEVRCSFVPQGCFLPSFLPSFLPPFLPSFLPPFLGSLCICVLIPYRYAFTFHPGVPYSNVTLLSACPVAPTRARACGGRGRGGGGRHRHAKLNGAETTPARPSTPAHHRRGSDGGTGTINKYGIRPSLAFLRIAYSIQWVPRFKSAL